MTFWPPETGEVWPWLGITLLAAGAVVAGWALRGDRARGRKRCAGCGYDMAGAPSLTCPECGRTAGSAREFERPRRRYRWAAVGALLILLAWPASRAPLIQRHGWLAAVPLEVLVSVWPLSEDYTDETWDHIFMRLQQYEPGWMDRRLAQRMASRMVKEGEAVGAAWVPVVRDLADVYAAIPDAPASMRPNPPFVSLNSRVEFANDARDAILLHAEALLYSLQRVVEPDVWLVGDGDCVLRFIGTSLVAAVPAETVPKIDAYIDAVRRTILGPTGTAAHLGGSASRAILNVRDLAGAEDADGRIEASWRLKTRAELSLAVASWCGPPIMARCVPRAEVDGTGSYMIVEWTWKRER